MTRKGNAWLCEAWGETDRPCAYLAVDRESVLRFIISEWLGDKDSEELPGIMAQFDAHDWGDEPLAWRFEIGGVRITDVFAVTPNKD